jgi:hypothetical protein
VYLTGAHAAGWEGRETERNRDARRLAPHAEGLTADQGGLFLLGIATLHRLSAGGARDDRLVLQAVSTLRSTVETRTKGILYEHQAQDARAQVLAAALDEALAGSQEERRAPPDRDLLAALSALEACITATLREGPGSSTFLEMAGRIASRLPAAPDPAPQPLIVTP